MNEIITYLKEKVIGKPLKTGDVIYYLENETLEGVYSDLMTFSDLLITENGMQFNMTAVTKEKIYILDSNKNRIGMKKDYTGTSVFQYKLAIRRSSGQITGYMSCLSSTVAFDPGVRFYQEHNKLRFEYVPKLYDIDPLTLAKTLSTNQYPSFIRHYFIFIFWSYGTRTNVIAFD